MRGGVWGYVDKNEFINAGLRFANDALKRYPSTYWPPGFFAAHNTLNPSKVKQAYLSYYNTHKGTKIQTFEYTKDNFMSNLSKQQREKELLSSSDFDNVYDYISNPSSKGEDKQAGVLTGRNQRYIDFLPSFEAFVKGTEELKTMSTQNTPLKIEIETRIKASNIFNGIKGAVGSSPNLANLTKTATDLIPKSGNAGVDFMVKMGAKNAGTVAKLGSFGFGMVGPAKALELAKLTSKVYNK